MTINYTITLHSDWHCSSGQSGGFGVDIKVIRDRHGLPFIPGRTLKGLLRNAAKNLKILEEGKSEEWELFIQNNFGQREGLGTKCFFSNGELAPALRGYLAKQDKKRFLYREIAATAINQQGVALEHSLRLMETVVPLTLEAAIHNFDDDRKKLERCMQWIKPCLSG